MFYGMDFTSLAETERLGGKFFADGKEVDLIEYLAQCGVTSTRLRLWLDPYDENGAPYMGGTCDLATVESLAKRAKAAGMDFLLDLHYSDFWCDPARQMIPKAWQGQDLDTMCQSLYDYTAEVLEHFKKAGVEPAAVQVGNEITNGMLWPLGRLSDESPRQGYDSLAKLLNAGCKAVREHSGAKIVLHLERSGDKATWQDWLDAMVERDVPFDVIGASYYPYWHGTMEALRENLESCIRRYGKDIWVVETAYPFTTEHFNPGSETVSLCIANAETLMDGSPVTHPLTIEGQQAFLRDLFTLVSELPDGRGKSVYWWEPGWLGIAGSAWASPASLRYCGEEGKACGNEWANQCLFDYSGEALPALYEFRHFIQK